MGVEAVSRWTAMLARTRTFEGPLTRAQQHCHLVSRSQHPHPLIQRFLLLRDRERWGTRLRGPCRIAYMRLGFSAACSMLILRVLTCMADTSVVYLYPHLMRFWRFDLNIFDGQIFASFPRNRRLERFNICLSRGLRPATNLACDSLFFQSALYLLDLDGFVGLPCLQCLLPF